MLTSHIIRTAVEAALAEDAPYGDITCETTIPADETGSAHLTARENGVMSGIDVFAAAFAAQNPAVTVTAAIKDGERFQRGHHPSTGEKIRHGGTICVGLDVPIGLPRCGRQH